MKLKIYDDVINNIYFPSGTIDKSHNTVSFISEFNYGASLRGKYRYYYVDNLNKEYYIKYNDMIVNTENHTMILDIDFTNFYSIIFKTFETKNSESHYFYIHDIDLLFINNRGITLGLHYYEMEL